MREEIHNLLIKLKGEFETKVDDILADYTNRERFNAAWDAINLLVDYHKQPNLKKILLNRVVNEIHSGINVTARNKRELKERIMEITDENLNKALLNRLETKEEVELYSPEEELQKTLKDATIKNINSLRIRDTELSTPESSIYEKYADDTKSEASSATEGTTVVTES